VKTHRGISILLTVLGAGLLAISALGLALFVVIKTL
jgi:hypothetical protein